MIQKALKEAIADFVIKNLRDPEHIIMHPNDWSKLLSETSIGGRWSSEVKTGKFSSYEGIQVLRSFDVAEGNFKIG